MARRSRGFEPNDTAGQGAPRVHVGSVVAVVFVFALLGAALVKQRTQQGATTAGSAQSVQSLIASLKSRGRNSHRWRPEPLASKGAVAVPSLVTVLESGDEFERRRALQVLEVMGPKGAGAEGALVHMALRDPDVHMRLGAAAALAKVGEPVVPTLVGFLAGSDAEWRLARTTLPRVGKAAVGPVAAALDHPEAGVRRLAIEILGEMVDQARGAREAVEAARDHPDPEVRAIAERAVRD